MKSAQTWTSNNTIGSMNVKNHCYQYSLGLYLKSQEKPHWDIGIGSNGGAEGIYSDKDFDLNHLNPWPTGVFSNY